MEAQVLTAEDLLSGTDSILDVSLPKELIGGSGEIDQDETGIIKLRPLSIGTFNLVLRAAQNERGLVPLLMIKESMVEPKLTLDQIKNMQLGLTEFIVSKIKTISGLNEKKNYSN